MKKRGSTMSDDMKRDIETLRADLSALRLTARNLAVAVSRVEGGMIESDTRFGGDRSKGCGAVLRRLDDFSGEVDISRRERKLQDESFNTLHESILNHE